MDILKAISIEEVETAFGGEIPERHPHSYIESRLRDEMLFIVQSDDNKIIGCLIYDIWWGNTPFIEYVNVLEQHQRKGTGLALLNAAKQDLKSKGFDQAISSTELSNPLGLGFHDKAGFKKLESLNFPHGEEQFYIMDL